MCLEEPASSTAAPQGQTPVPRQKQGCAQITSLDLSANRWTRENRGGGPTAAEPGCTALEPADPMDATGPEELQDETVSGKDREYV
ncbi:hypothetical protein JEQ12_013368 [Ovis aries]|uniref:Uncharacterized protein n=1 Tax=Ovis aries TaxID=9940 RepID=A0A836A604_SHEEP|nr:hypothetical protein JEQ12_013368 [Ovis aries]